jgi:hypothetical protein
MQYFLFQRNSDKLRSKWSQKALQQEFKEALIAHASFRYPRFMFQHHEGLKVRNILFLSHSD